MGKNNYITSLRVMKWEVSLFFFLLIVTGCSLQRTLFKITNTDITEVRFASVNNNVCKKLYGKVVLYAIFVDTKVTHPWTEYDIRSTLDSIQYAVNWLEKQAKLRNIELDITIEYPNYKGHIPISQDLPKKTLSSSLYTPNVQLGVKAVKRWSDKIAASIGKNLNPDTSRIITTKNTLSDKERLIARLRDDYKTDNVALMYFVNNYYKDEISVAINTNSNCEIEYSIVSFKNPAVIAHEFLHLQGAWDLYLSPFDNKKKKDNGRKEFVNKEFPNEIMAYAFRDIDSLEISPFTEYCIGWDKKLDDKYAEMILGKKLKPVSY
jgi:hypothetical protein